MLAWSAGLNVVVPEMILLAACVLVVAGGRLGVRGVFVRWVPMAAVVLSMLSVVTAWNPSFPEYAFSDMLVRDGFSGALTVVILSACLLALPHLSRKTNDGSHDRAGLHVLVLLVSAGLMLLVSTTDLIALFLVVETLSALMYALPTVSNGDRLAHDQAAKYLPFSLASATVATIGIALVFSTTGSTDLVGIAQHSWAADASIRPMLSAGFGLIVLGLVFTACLTPTRVRAEGHPSRTPVAVTAFISAGVKAALFMALSRALLSGFPRLVDQWQHLLSAGAVFAMVIGHAGALFQTRLVGLLRYSAVGHFGFITLALVSGSRFGVSSMVFYVFACSVMALGALGIIAYISGRERCATLGDCAGLISVCPIPAALLAVFMLGLGGVPLTMGFIALFQSLLAGAFTGHTGLVAVGLMMSVVSAFYHLRVAGLICCRSAPVDRERPHVPASVIAVTALAALTTIALGVYPTPVLRILRTIILPGT